LLHIKPHFTIGIEEGEFGVSIIGVVEHHSRISALQVHVVDQMMIYDGTVLNWTVFLCSVPSTLTGLGA
jgi:hypothetical protein